MAMLLAVRRHTAIHMNRGLKLKDTT